MEHHGPKPKAERQLQTAVGGILRGGVAMAAAIVLFGAAVFLIRHGADRPDYAAFHGQPADLTSLRGIFRQSEQFSGRGLIQLGLIVLIATPVLRVIVAGIGFAVERDWLYVAVSLVVLALLMYGLIGGRGEGPAAREPQALASQPTHGTWIGAPVRDRPKAN